MRRGGRKSSPLSIWKVPCALMNVNYFNRIAPKINKASSWASASPIKIMNRGKLRVFQKYNQLKINDDNFYCKLFSLSLFGWAVLCTTRLLIRSLCTVERKIIFTRKVMRSIVRLNKISIESRFKCTFFSICHFTKFNELLAVYDIKRSQAVFALFQTSPRKFASHDSFGNIWHPAPKAMFI